MNHVACCVPAAPSAGTSLAQMLARACRKGEDFLIRSLDALDDWHDRAASRRHLGALDDRMLRDIGIDRAQAANESAKPFWRP